MAKKVRSKIKTVVSTVIIIIAVLLIVIYFTLNMIVAKGIEKFGTEATGTEVEVQSVYLSPFAGSLEIKGLSVANPKGYHSGNALTLNRFFVSMNIKSLLSDKIIINEVLIENVSIDLEPSLTAGSNLQEISNNISAYTASEKTQEKTPSQPSEQKPGKTVIIKHLLIQDGTVSISSSMLRNNIIVPMAKIEMYDIGENNSQSAEEIVQTVFNQLILGVSSAASGVQGISLDSINLEGISKASGDVEKSVSDGLKSLGSSIGF